MLLLLWIVIRVCACARARSYRALWLRMATPSLGRTLTPQTVGTAPPPRRVGTGWVDGSPRGGGGGERWRRQQQEPEHAAAAASAVQRQRQQLDEAGRRWRAQGLLSKPEAEAQIRNEGLVIPGEEAFHTLFRLFAGPGETISGAELERMATFIRESEVVKTMNGDRSPRYTSPRDREPEVEQEAKGQQQQPPPPPPPSPATTTQLRSAPVEDQQALSLSPAGPAPPQSLPSVAGRGGGAHSERVATVDEAAASVPTSAQERLRSQLYGQPPAEPGSSSATLGTEYREGVQPLASNAAADRLADLLYGETARQMEAEASKPLFSHSSDASESTAAPHSQPPPVPAAAQPKTSVIQPPPSWDASPAAPEPQPEQEQEPEPEPRTALQAAIDAARAETPPQRRPQPEAHPQLAEEGVPPAATPETAQQPEPAEEAHVQAEPGPGPEAAAEADGSSAATAVAEEETAEADESLAAATAVAEEATATGGDHAAALSPTVAAATAARGSGSPLRSFRSVSRQVLRSSSMTRAMRPTTISQAEKDLAALLAKPFESEEDKAEQARQAAEQQQEEMARAVSAVITHQRVLIPSGRVSRAQGCGRGRRGR
jgi:hypothetical protein